MASADSLTRAEKVALTAGRDFWSLHGVERLGVPAIWVADGPHGLRKEKASSELTLTDTVPATCFPTAAALAATWDVALVEDVGAAIGREAAAEGVSVVLGPGANIKRTPLCGRNFEYFSEDPLLSGELAAAWIRGAQGEGVGASLKHYACNNQEHRRYTVDTLVDERALREIYLATWERALEATPWTVMAAYNRFEGTYCTEHRRLLTEILTRERGFDGVVVSDWGAVSDRTRAVAAGLDLQMPGFGGQGDAEVAAAAAGGRLPEEALDRAAGRILRLVERTARAREPGRCYDREAHHALARRAAAAGTVLLKNDGGVLPLAAGGSIAVLGAFAREPRYQGAGSSLINPPHVDEPYSELAALLGGRAELSYAPGYARHGEEVDRALVDAARTAAGAADVAVVFAGLPEAFETEGLDRRHLRLPAAHDALIAAVAAANPRTVVVLQNGAPVELPWHDRVPAILEAYLGGQAGGSALARVLLGIDEPGGRLAETFPRRLSDNPVHALPIGPRQVEYRESVFVGYRYYDTAGVDVRYPFGHGLGYTSFAYDELTPSARRIADGDELEVAVTVENTGNRAGSEVVQVYVHAADSSAFAPEQELRGFARVTLEPGASTRVRVTLDRRAFARWDVDQNRFAIEPGRFELRVGASSRDIRATATVELTAEHPASAPSEPAAYRDLRPGRPFDRAAFAELYGRPLPDNVPERPGEFTRDSALADMRGSPAIRALLALARRRMRSQFGGDEGSPQGLLGESLLQDMTLRMLAAFSRGAVTPRMLDGLVALANRRRVAGGAALAHGTAVAVWQRVRRR